MAKFVSEFHCDNQHLEYSLLAMQVTRDSNMNDGVLLDHLRASRPPRHDLTIICLDREPMAENAKTNTATVICTVPVLPRQRNLPMSPNPS